MTDKDVIYGDEISLRDLVDTLCAGWKYLLVSSVVGATLGAGIWFSQGYKGELTAYVRPGTLNVVSWNALLAGLPGLADVKLYKMDSDAEKERILQALVSPAWWKAKRYQPMRYRKAMSKILHRSARRVLIRAQWLFSALRSKFPEILAKK